MRAVGLIFLVFLSCFSQKVLSQDEDANAWDFAYTNWKKYRKKNIGDHIKLFAAGGAGGFLNQALKDQFSSISNPSLSEKAQFFSNVFSVSVVDFNLQGYAKSDEFAYYKGSQPNKMGVLGLKWLLTPLSF